MDDVHFLCVYVCDVIEEIKSDRNRMLAPDYEIEFGFNFIQTAIRITTTTTKYTKTHAAKHAE